MKILAIESSCDETAAAVVEDGRKVLSSVISTQVAEHRKYGGVVPEIASRRHAENIVPVVDKALADAQVTLEDVDAIAVTHAPGLIGALLVGVNFAKGLSLATGKPLIPTHHLRSHIASNYISNSELKPPFLCLVVSGGHSHIVMVEDYTKMRIIGKTRDDAAGEAFDKAARTMGMPYPGGIELDKVAENGDPYAFKLPRPVVHDAPYDFSFSGLKTFAVNLVHNASQKGEEVSAEDLGASFIKTVTDILTKNTISAAKDLGATQIVLAGGVAANSRLRAMLAERSDLNCIFPPLKLCGDNGAMIGAQAYYEYLAGNTAGMELNAYATKSILGESL